MSKTTKPLPARAMIVGRADFSDFDARARPVSELLREVDELTAETDDAPGSGRTLDPSAVYARWNAPRRALRRSDDGHG